MGVYPVPHTELEIRYSPWESLHVPVSTVNQQCVLTHKLFEVNLKRERLSSPQYCYF